MKPTRATISTLHTAATELVQRAARNLDRSGLQTPAVLTLCIGEEQGKICRAVLEAKGERETDAASAAYIGTIRDEALDLGALCVQFVTLCDCAAGLAFTEEQDERGG